MNVGKLSLIGAAAVVGAWMLPAPSAEAHGRHWRGDRVRVVYRSVPRYRVVYRAVPRYRVVHRPRYYSTYAYRPYRSYEDGYYGWGYRYRPGFSLSIGHRGGFIGFGGGGFRW